NADVVRGGPASACMRALMARLRMPRLHPPYSSGFGPHDDALGRDMRTRPVHACQHRAVGHAGRRKDHIAGGEIVQGIFAIEIGDAQTPRALSLLVVAKYQAGLDLSTDTTEGRRGENALGCAALPD